MKSFLIFIIVILLIGVVTLVGMVISHFSNPQKNIPTTVAQASNRAYDLRSDTSPPHAPDWLTWEIALSTDPQSIASIEKNSFLFTEEGILIPNLSFTGREWTSTQSFQTQEEHDSAKSVISYYLGIFPDEGWDYSIEIDEGKIVKGAAANGTVGHVLSHIKLEKDSLRIIVLSSQTDSEKCPCTTTNRIFLSNPIPLSNVIDNFPEQ